ncbi:class A beta-lactamase-related serine hydrolase [bacterium]|nr:MAG: class A beta-lactamase-related serine hydrolase [bacterium]
MKPFSKLLICIVVAMSLLNCSDDGISDNTESTKSSEKNLLTFSINTDKNDVLVYSDGQIQTNQVLLFLPPTSPLDELIPEFTVSDKASVKINGSPLISGTSSINLSGSVDISVVAEDGSQKTYTITPVTNFTSLDNAIRSYMTTYSIPGVQIAITKNEKLVYTQAYGDADNSLHIALTDSSLLRIASISKPITAIGILKLIEDGEFGINDFVFGEGAVLGTTYGTQPYSDEIKQITVKHLLDHTSGWINSPNDPMFSYRGYTHAELISELIDNRPLTYTPGATYYYSNFGYMILGRIIEKVTGKDYETYMKENILNPMGITDMEIGNDLWENRFSNEVTYYSQEGLDAYDMEVHRMDSHGGWIATATDLMKFMRYVDRSSYYTDLLNVASLNQMYFSYTNWIFYGSLPGTSSGICRLDDTYSFSFIVNTRTLPTNVVLDNVLNSIRNEIQARTSWPTYNLFVD